MNVPIFSLNSLSEVENFEELLDEFVRQRTGHALRHISLTKVYKIVQQRSDGMKIFTAFLDIQINFLLLWCDQYAVGAAFNRHFRGEKSTTVSILASQEIFSAKMDIHDSTTSFVLRYRALWDKIMGVLVLITAPECYEKFAAAKSRKKEFKKIVANIEHLSGCANSISDLLTRFDNKFRTPEAHGTGSVRKFSLSMQSFEATPHIELLNFWNVMNAIIGSIGELISKVNDNAPLPGNFKEINP